MTKDEVYLFAKQCYIIRQINVF